MATDTQTPEHYEIVEGQGSAYYLVTSESYAPELIQVPLDTEGEPCWEREPDSPYFGGGAVDWSRGFGDDADEQAAKAELLKVEDRLRGKHGLPSR